MTPCQHVPAPDVTHSSEEQSPRRTKIKLIKIKLIKRGCVCALLVTLTWKQRVTVMGEHT